MKKKCKYFILAFVTSLLLFSCELTEDPKFLTSDNLFTTVEGSNMALNGVYSSLASFNYYGANYHHLLNMSSGLFNSDRDASLLDIAGLNPPANLNFVTTVWQAMFQTISQANNFITSLSAADLGNKAEQNNLLGQSYFIRSLTYFNLVRIYGKSPLITETVTSENPYYGMAKPEDIYNQVIADAIKARELLPDKGENMKGRPDKNAASMLLAKVYMQLAGNRIASETDYWFQCRHITLPVDLTKRCHCFSFL